MNATSSPTPPASGKATQRMKRTPMAERHPQARSRCFDEVALGYSEDEAVAEAQRCIQCKKPECVAGCPVYVKIPQFIKCIAARDFASAAEILKETNALPAICGRVCPQETQCEKLCVLGRKSDPVAIGNLERFAADWAREHKTEQAPQIKPRNGKRIAVVGAGPAGLTAAGDLAKEGFEVTVFEAFPRAGGVLVYGIPEFRLPKTIVQQEVEYLERLGVRFEFNFLVGKTATLDELLSEEGYDAVFVGSGAGFPLFLGIPGENAMGVYSANEYLTRANLMKAYQAEATTPILRGKRVVTVGGGNVAMDSSRTALRLGADKSMLVYRRTEAEMPARLAEIHHAKEEGIEFHLLRNPTEIVPDEKGFVKAIRCLRMELGEPDESGRRRPVPVKGSEFDIPCDVVIIAIGNNPNQLIIKTTSGIQTSKHGTIITGKGDGRTTKKLVYAGGDVVTGAATVIEAMGAGKIAVQNIIHDLLGK